MFVLAQYGTHQEFKFQSLINLQSVHYYTASLLCIKQSCQAKIWNPLWNTTSPTAQQMTQNGNVNVGNCWQTENTGWSNLFGHIKSQHPEY